MTKYLRVSQHAPEIASLAKSWSHLFCQVSEKSNFSRESSI